MHKEKIQHDVRVKNIIDAENPVNQEMPLQEIEKDRLFEEEITGNAATMLHSLLTNPPKNPGRASMIEAAIKRFPHPGQPATLDMDL